jgi:hypothetical protein
MTEDMMVRNLAPATQQSCLYAVAKFSRHFGRSPDHLSLDDVRAYQVHLASKQQAWSHINQVACALRFFYGVTLGQTDAAERIVHTREPQKLPVVLSAELDVPPPDPEVTPIDYRERYALLTGRSLDICPCCGGRMVVIAILLRTPVRAAPAWCDSS